MADKKLYDNLFKVIKANSGPIEANETTLTEILDLQIPRNYCARIRKVIFHDNVNVDQQFLENFFYRGALILDPDDEEHYQIPTFTVDHDICCDFEHEYLNIPASTVEAQGGSVINNQKTIHEFKEDLDVVTVRNVRFNVQGIGLKVDGVAQSQCKCEVYFTYEKISIELYALLLGIS
ncbi:hypothetical protein ES703_95059 [subsurface metagenome]